jgi:RimJ/RimL family protein N-acetyltransferase
MTPINPSEVHLLPFKTVEHFNYYQTLVDQEPHADTDFYSSEELKNLISLNEIKAWLVSIDTVNGNQIIGWCAVNFPSSHHPLRNSVHFLGSIIDKPYRGQGFGFATFLARLKEFPENPITASILPGNIPSERMYISAGFKAGFMQGPWRTWHLPNEKSPMALVRNVSEALKYLNQGIHYVEIYRTPTESGEGVILRGLWPDPVAFTTVS